MFTFRISIYWKILLTLLASMFISTIVIMTFYVGYAPLIEVHPYIQSSLISQTMALSQRIAREVTTSSQTLEAIVDHIHDNEKANIRIFSRSGEVVVSRTEEQLQFDIKRISARTVEKTLKSGYDVFPIFPRLMLTPVVSVPLELQDGKTLLLRVYYPVTKGMKSVLPRGLPEIVSIIILGGFTVILARYLTRPLRELNRAAQKMSEGKFGTQVKIRSHDEVGQLAKTFNTMSNRLEELRRSRRELFTDISHELRSPLARIFTDAEILIDKHMDGEKREQHLKSICNEVKTLDKLIGDLSTLARFDQEKLNFSLTFTTLQGIISQAASLFLLQCEENGITLKQAIAEDVPRVMIDPQRIGQVISNLIMNALRYTPQGGTIEIGLKSAGAMAEVWVRDSGEGIPEDKLPFIFERFYRVDKSRSRATGGSGLGLAIARQLVEAHGGGIQAESILGQGTCISFTIPLPLS